MLGSKTLPRDVAILVFVHQGLQFVRIPQESPTSASQNKIRYIHVKLIKWHNDIDLPHV